MKLRIGLISRTFFNVPLWSALDQGMFADAGLQSGPLSYMAEDAGFSNLAATTDFIPDYQFTTVNADRGWAAAWARGPA